MMQSSRKDILVEQLYELWTNQILCDAILVCKDGIELKTHRVILAAATESFRPQKGQKTVITGMYYVHYFRNISYKTMHMVIKYIYGKQITLSATNVSVIQSLAKTIKLNSLVLICDQYISNMRTVHTNTVVYEVSTEDYKVPTTRTQKQHKGHKQVKYGMHIDGIKPEECGVTQDVIVPKVEVNVDDTINTDNIEQIPNSNAMDYIDCVDESSRYEEGVTVNLAVPKVEMNIDDTINDDTVQHTQSDDTHYTEDSDMYGWRSVDQWRVPKIEVDIDGTQGVDIQKYNMPIDDTQGVDIQQYNMLIDDTQGADIQQYNMPIDHIKHTDTYTQGKREPKHKRIYKHTTASQIVVTGKRKAKRKDFGPDFVENAVRSSKKHKTSASKQQKKASNEQAKLCMNKKCKLWKCKFCSCKFEHYSTMKLHLKMTHKTCIYHYSLRNSIRNKMVLVQHKCYAWKTLPRRKECRRRADEVMSMSKKRKSMMRGKGGTTREAPRSRCKPQSRPLIMPHSKNHHNKVPNKKCPYCGVYFTCKGLPMHVIRIHKKQRITCPHLCDICLQRFCSERDLTAHRITIHKKGPTFPVYLSCMLCLKAFMFKEEYAEHIKTVHQKVAYICLKDSCTATFMDPPAEAENQLDAHLTDAHGEAKQKCPECEFSTALWDSLVSHMLNIHQQYTCIHCDTTLQIKRRQNIKASTWLLHEHMMEQHGIVFDNHLKKCHITDCNFTTYRSQKLIRHSLESHRKSSPPTCPQCNTCFKNNRYEL